MSTALLSSEAVHQLFSAGRFDQALAAQRQRLAAAAPGSDSWRGEARNLAVIAAAAGKQPLVAEMQSAILAAAIDPVERRRARFGLAGALLRLGDTAAARREALICLEEGEASPQLHTLLASAAGRLGNAEEIRLHGRRALELWDAEVCLQLPPLPLLSRRRPTFRPDLPSRNLIAFSLFGPDGKAPAARYLAGALRNARLAPEIYPGWTCRFYVDSSVSAAFRTELGAAGAQVAELKMPGRTHRLAGLFWRFHAWSDPAADFFLCRDVDSVINPRERVAVDEWLASDRDFHVMRDAFTHTDLILAGMWGGVCRRLPPLEKLWPLFDSGSQVNLDQQFLARFIWPLIKGAVMIHDSCFGAFDARDFPGQTRLAPGRSVGDNDYLFASR